jgi:hypothetical protein
MGLVGKSNSGGPTSLLQVGVLVLGWAALIERRSFSNLESVAEPTENGSRK